MSWKCRWEHWKELAAAKREDLALCLDIVILAVILAKFVHGGLH
jgi:hypothetical protein